MSLLVSGSVVQLADTIQVLSQLDFSGSTNPRYHLASTSNTRDLILSSANANVTVSGALNVKNLGGLLNVSNGGLTSTNASSQNYSVAVSSSFGANLARLHSTNASAAGLQLANATLLLRSTGDIEVYSNSSTQKFRLFSTGSDAIMVGHGFHFILSASSVVAMSAALKLMTFASTGSLPQGVSAVTGSVVYVNDIATFAGYTPNGWVPFLTGSPFILS
jgi:hypothetical protein